MGWSMRRPMSSTSSSVPGTGDRTAGGIGHDVEVPRTRRRTVIRPTASAAAAQPARSLPVSDETSVPATNPASNSRDAPHASSVIRGGRSSSAASPARHRAPGPPSTGTGPPERRRRAPARRVSRNRRRSDDGNGDTWFGCTYPLGYRPPAIVARRAGVPPGGRRPAGPGNVRSLTGTGRRSPVHGTSRPSASPTWPPAPPGR